MAKLLRFQLDNEQGIGNKEFLIPILSLINKKVQIQIWICTFLFETQNIASLQFSTFIVVLILQG